MTYYDLLEITNTASIEVIKAAYKVQVDKCHSDAYTGNPERINLINIAYDTLSDAEKREKYDDFLKERAEFVEEKTCEAGKSNNEKNNIEETQEDQFPDDDDLMEMDKKNLSNKVLGVIFIVGLLLILGYFMYPQLYSKKYPQVSGAELPLGWDIPDDNMDVQSMMNIVLLPNPTADQLVDFTDKFDYNYLLSDEGIKKYLGASIVVPATVTQNGAYDFTGYLVKTSFCRDLNDNCYMVVNADKDFTLRTVKDKHVANVGSKVNVYGINLGPVTIHLDNGNTKKALLIACKYHNSSDSYECNSKVSIPDDSQKYMSYFVEGHDHNSIVASQCVTEIQDDTESTNSENSNEISKFQESQASTSTDIPLEEWSQVDSNGNLVPCPNADRMFSIDATNSSVARSLGEYGVYFRGFESAKGDDPACWVEGRYMSCNPTQWYCMDVYSLNKFDTEMNVYTPMTVDAISSGVTTSMLYIVRIAEVDVDPVVGGYCMGDYCTSVCYCFRGTDDLDSSYLVPLDVSEPFDENRSYPWLLKFDRNRPGNSRNDYCNLISHYNGGKLDSGQDADWFINKLNKMQFDLIERYDDTPFYIE